MKFESILSRFQHGQIFVHRVRASPAHRSQWLKRGTETVTLANGCTGGRNKIGKRSVVSVWPSGQIRRSRKTKVEIHYAPAEALYRAISQTWETARLTIVVMGHTPSTSPIPIFPGRSPLPTMLANPPSSESARSCTFWRSSA